jgi:hypothetical protein
MIFIVFTDDSTLVGEHRVDVIATCVYTNQAILPYLVDICYKGNSVCQTDDLLDVDTHIRYDEFDITITTPPVFTAPGPGPKFVAELEDEVKILGEDWDWFLP